jgi:hypothetical protein
MTTRWTTVKRSVGLAAMATAVTAAGLGLGSGAAQAKPMPTPHPIPAPILKKLDRADAFVDKVAPNSFLAKVLNKVTGE